MEFFAPFMPCSIRIILDESNRPSGKADVEFKTHEEAEAAMSRDKSNMSKSMNSDLNLYQLAINCFSFRTPIY